MVSTVSGFVQRTHIDWQYFPLHKKNEPALVGIPLTNPMGWVSSPPNFSACTETVCDMANVDLKNVESMRNARTTPHRLDVVSESRPANALTATGVCTCTSKTNINFTIRNPGSENFHDSENFHNQNPVLVSEFVQDPKFDRDPKFV